MRQLPTIVKQLQIAGLVLLFLTACGQQEQATPAVEEQPVAQAEAVETVTDEVVAADEIVEEVLEVVEESAAEPEDGEQAILLAQADTKPAISVRTASHSIQ
jgi:nitrogen regulatory protein PII